ncbi:NUDIX hydrolase domain-like protein [Biscogniauxia mediterranea]|nr:NUDIX hydrolase domain-like protein [Biscogniauxia mediterranea]
MSGIPTTTIKSDSGSAPPVPTAFTVAPSAHNFNVPLQDFTESCEGVSGIAVGACVFNPDGKVLLVQRAPTDSLPLLWEVPGGGCDFEDETVLHSVARELWEESGLRAQRIGDELGVLDLFRTRRGLRVRKFTFLVEVDGYDVRLDPSEHQAFLWASEEDVRAKRCGNVEIVYTNEAQEEVIRKAFERRKALYSSCC